MPKRRFRQLPAGCDAAAGHRARLRRCREASGPPAPAGWLPAALRLGVRRLQLSGGTSCNRPGRRRRVTTDRAAAHSVAHRHRIAHRLRRQRLGGTRRRDCAHPGPHGAQALAPRVHVRRESRGGRAPRRLHVPRVLPAPAVRRQHHRDVAKLLVPRRTRIVRDLRPHRDRLRARRRGPAPNDREIRGRGSRGSRRRFAAVPRHVPPVRRVGGRRRRGCIR